MNSQTTHQKTHIFDHPEFGRLRVFEDENGKLNFSLEDIARSLGMTMEEAIDHLNNISEETIQ